MNRYLLIESRDPWTDADALRFQDFAVALARQGHAVSLLLVQNGVFPARREARHAAALARVAEQGVAVLADEFSLRERGIGEAELAPGVAAAAIGVVIDLMESGCKAVWH